MSRAEAREGPNVLRQTTKRTCASSSPLRPIEATEAPLPPPRPFAAPARRGWAAGCGALVGCGGGRRRIGGCNGRAAPGPHTRPLQGAPERSELRPGRRHEHGSGRAHYNADHNADYKGAGRFHHCRATSLSSTGCATWPRRRDGDVPAEVTFCLDRRPSEGAVLDRNQGGEQQRAGFLPGDPGGWDGFEADGPGVDPPRGPDLRVRHR